MNAYLHDLELSEPVLDIGGGAFGSSSHHHVIPNYSSLRTVSLNLEEDRNPTMLGDAQGLLPFRESSFGSCLAFNLLEHVLHVERVLLDVRRVLKNDGVFVIGVPFLCRVHGDPCDYFRYTEYALKALLEKGGFKVERIRPCGMGAVTAALSQVDFALPKAIRRPTFTAARTMDQIITRRSGGRHRNAHDYPLGYLAVCCPQSTQ